MRNEPLAKRLSKFLKQDVPPDVAEALLEELLRENAIATADVEAHIASLQESLPKLGVMRLTLLDIKDGR